MLKLDAFILGEFLFLSVSAGGGIAWIVSKIFHGSSEGLALLCGGFLVGLLTLDIIPSALKMNQLSGIVLGVLIGYIFLAVVNNLFFTSKSRKPSISLLILALFIHTIPISLSIGNLLGNSTIAVSITTSTILHHVPEGFALTSAFLSQGKKIMMLFVCFISLSVCFSTFIWIGLHANLTIRAQSVLLGTSIGMIAITSVKEFILNNIRVVPTSLLVIFLMIGFLLSVIFHMVF
ncbi:zinc transporter family protein [Psychrobacillus sp. NPDC058041]|uniref:zinc transporter family protein n=1 Tax=Psychrobacillus sp. NPDC058041 TaxID=3346310 RepID=UPI0036D869BD